MWNKNEGRTKIFDGFFGFSTKLTHFPPKQVYENVTRDFVYTLTHILGKISKEYWVNSIVLSKI